jgi:hypothetical protein
MFSLDGDIRVVSDIHFRIYVFNRIYPSSFFSEWLALPVRACGHAEMLQDLGLKEDSGGRCHQVEKNDTLGVGTFDFWYKRYMHEVLDEKAEKNKITSFL